MVIAPISSARAHGLNELLATMMSLPGLADPANRAAPFRAVRPLALRAAGRARGCDSERHREAYDRPPPKLPTYLAFMGDCDGPAGEFLVDLARRASAGLRQVFSHCEDFTPEADLTHLQLQA